MRATLPATRRREGIVMPVPRRSREVHAEPVDITFDAVRADALELLSTDPEAYFRATYKPLPTGYRPNSKRGQR